VLFTLFYLLAFHSYLTYYPQPMVGESGGLFVLFLLLWMLSLLSKEMAASLPILIFVLGIFAIPGMRGPDRSGDACGKRLRKPSAGTSGCGFCFSIAGIAFHGLLGFHKEGVTQGSAWKV